MRSRSAARSRQGPRRLSPYAKRRCRKGSATRPVTAGSNRDQVAVRFVGVAHERVGRTTDEDDRPRWLVEKIGCDPRVLVQDGLGSLLFGERHVRQVAVVVEDNGDRQLRDRGPKQAHAARERAGSTRPSRRHRPGCAGVPARS